MISKVHQALLIGLVFISLGVIAIGLIVRHAQNVKNGES